MCGWSPWLGLGLTLACGASPQQTLAIRAGFRRGHQELV